MNRFKPFQIVLLLFLLAVLVRVPNLDRPLSKHHEFNAAFFLIPLEIWTEEGVQNHGHLPTYNYANPGDLFVPEPIAIASGEKSGRYYYLSLPPLSYIVPYYFFKCFGLQPSPLNLQFFNLILHALVLFFLFKTLTQFFTEKNALMATVMYLFAPGPLWFHGNGYTHHVFAVLPLIMTIYFFVKCLKDENPNSKHLFGFAVSLAVLLFSEWIGVFFTLTAFGIALVQFRSKKYWRVAFVSALVGLISLGLLLLLYVSFMGWEQYKSYMFDRFVERSGMESAVGFFGYVVRWLYWSLVSYGLWMPLLFVAAILFFLKRKGAISSIQKQTILLIFLPLLMYHIVFREFAYVHEYSVLYHGLLWAFLTVLFLENIDWSQLELIQKIRPFLNAIKISSLSFVCALFIAQYYFINRPGEVGQNGDRYDQLMIIGQTIRQNVQPDERIFLHIPDGSLDFVNPQINFYAKRNFKPVQSRDEINNFMLEYGGEKAHVFFIENGNIVDAEVLTFGE